MTERVRRVTPRELKAQRDDVRDHVEMLIREGKGGTAEFHEYARLFHRLASQVGYPTWRERRS